jgi:hypothetical protein
MVTGPAVWCVVVEAVVCALVPAMVPVMVWPAVYDAALHDADTENTSDIWKLPFVGLKPFS